MARTKKRIDGDLPKANLTPMIDVTFQLIIFFLLVNNIVSAESVSMLVPKLYDPKVVELGEVKRLVISIVPAEDPESRKTAADALMVSGDAIKVQLGSSLVYDIGNLDDLVAQLKESVARDPEIQVLMRADAATYYDRVQPVLAAITSAGIKTVNLVAFLPDEGPENLIAK